MTLNNKKEIYGIHHGWGELFKHALIENNIRDINIHVNEFNECDIRQLRSLHYSIIDRLNNDIFSIDIVNSISAFTFDCYSMLLWTSSSLNQLIDDAVKYFIYISSIIRLKKIESLDYIEVWIFNNSIDNSDKITDIGLITIVSMFLTVIQKVTSTPINKIQCAIPVNNCSLNVVNEIKERFNVNVIDSNYYSLRFLKSELTTKLKDSNEAIYNACYESIRKRVNKLKDNDTICQIYNILDKSTTLEDISLDTVASELFISARTLSRRLYNLDTAFNIVFTNYRIELSLYLLKETNKSLCEIAYRLGFSGQSSFNHAFKRWTGYSPLTVRKSSG